MIPKLLEFMDEATPTEVQALADKSGTSIKYLVHLARGYGGGRKPSVDLAVRIEAATREMHKAHRKLPVITCEDLAGE